MLAKVNVLFLISSLGKHVDNNNSNISESFQTLGFNKYLQSPLTPTSSIPSHSLQPLLNISRGDHELNVNLLARLILDRITELLATTSSKNDSLEGIVDIIVDDGVSDLESVGDREFVSIRQVLEVLLSLLVDESGLKNSETLVEFGKGHSDTEVISRTELLVELTLDICHLLQEIVVSQFGNDESVSVTVIGGVNRLSLGRVRNMEFCGEKERHW